MIHPTRLCGVALALAWSAQVQAGQCTSASGVVSAGRDVGGYFVHLDWPAGAARGGVDISQAADYLALEAGVTILYRTEFSDPIRESQTWRGRDPLATLQAVATTGNLAIDASTPGLWVVRRSAVSDYASVTIIARPLDPGDQGIQPVSQIGDIERALLNQLPVRDLYGLGERAGIELSYYWLAEEGRDAMLVVYQARALDAHIWGSGAYKVRVQRGDSRVTIDCVWANSDIAAGLVPEIAEDFDGDGYRDFVFDSANGIRTVLPAAIVSGRDGKTLLRFAGPDLAVEEKASGPKRIATTLFPLSPHEEPYLSSLRLDEGARRYYVDKSPAGTTATPSESAQSPADPSRLNAAELLAGRVGDAKNVRLYQLKSTAPNYAVDDAMISRGYPGHILFHYESPGFTAEQERAEEELRLHPPTPPQVTGRTRREKPLVPRALGTPSPTPVRPDVVPEQK